MTKTADTDPNEKLTVSELEREHGVLMTDLQPNKKMTRQEFAEALSTEQYIGVDYDFRLQWLKDNGYPATRANIGNADLPTKLKDV